MHEERYPKEFACQEKLRDKLEALAHIVRSVRPRRDDRSSSNECTFFLTMVLPLALVFERYVTTNLAMFVIIT